MSKPKKNKTTNSIVLRKQDKKKEAVLKALEDSLGVVTTACKVTKTSRKSYYEWLHNDPEFAAAVEDIQEVALDFAESKLYKQIQNDNITATIFYLKTKGKHRGYIERAEIDHRGQLIGKIQVEVVKNAKK